MNTVTSCSKCGSSKVVPRARVIDRGDHSVRLGVARKPEAIFFKAQEKVDLYARVCGECGYAQLFVEDAGSIYETYVESQRGGS